MKKIMFLLTGCLIWGITFAQQTPGTNVTERAAKKAQQKQSKRFQNTRRYSSVVNNHQAKALKRQQAKASGKA